MSLSTRSPVRVAGSVQFSGGVATNEVSINTGGVMAGTIYSGMASPSLRGTPGAVATGDQVLLASGAGRLKTIIPHTRMTSGLPVQFYDAAVVARSGGAAATMTESGARVIAVIPPTFQGQWSGSALNDWPTIIKADMPFQSGLYVNCTSGTPGWTASWIPEVNPVNPQV